MMLGLSELDSKEPEIVEEQYEEEVFKIASFFLNRAFIPKLAQSKIARLKKLELAFVFLNGNQFSGFQFCERDYGFLNTSTIEQLVVAEQSAEMKLKLALSHAQDACSAAIALDNWSQMVLQYAKRFIELFPFHENDIPQVASTLMVDYGALLAEIKMEKLDGLAVQEYARLSRLI